MAATKKAETTAEVVEKPAVVGDYEHGNVCRCGECLVRLGVDTSS